MSSEPLRALLIGLQRNGISDLRVLEAIAQTPREAFISEGEYKQYAYADEALPIECEQTISQPYVVAFMTERLHLAPEHEVLEIGTGSGYQTAILSRLARHVYTIETHTELHRLATVRLSQLGIANVTAAVGDGTRGWPQFRLFDRILVTAGAQAVPEQLLRQLAPGGFMVIPLGPLSDQRITLITRGSERVIYQPLLPVRFVPLVPEPPVQAVARPQ
jgi:protein-L-isoaspartate(D-aspartate) O-methyltransferase